MFDMKALNHKLNSVSRHDVLYRDLVDAKSEIERLLSLPKLSTDMRIVKFRFFDYKLSLKLGRKRTLAGEIIKRRSALTHSEFQFSSFYNNLSFSATIEDAFKGCRFRLIGYSHAWWRTEERVITAEEEACIWAKAHSINGKKYDLFGLGSHATPWKIIRPHRDRYWCSESNAYITLPYIYMDARTEITPDELYEWLRAHPQAA